MTQEKEERATKSDQLNETVERCVDFPVSPAKVDAV